MRAVTDYYFGHAISDPYRWMEDAGSDELRNWLSLQNEYARRTLTKLPFKGEFERRVQELSSSTRVVREARVSSGSIFFLDRSPGQQKPSLRVLEAGNDTARLLVDMEHTTATFDFLSPSPKGKYVAYGISSSGTEDSNLHVIEVASRTEVVAPIRGCRAGHVSWLPDESGFFYTQEPEVTAASSESYLNQRVYLHRIGESSKADVEIFGPNDAASDVRDPLSDPRILVDPDSRQMVLAFDHSVLDPLTLAVARAATKSNGAPPRWKKIAGPEDLVLRAAFRADNVYVLASKNAPRRRLEQWQIDENGVRKRKTIFESATAVLTELVASRDGLYVSTFDRDKAGMLFVPYGSETPRTLELPVEGSITGLTASPGRAGALFRIEGWTSAPTWLVAKSTGVVEAGLGRDAAVAFGDTVVEHVDAKSHDGVLIPITLLYTNGLPRNGQNPTWLTAYGSYGISLEPSFRPVRKAWLERGGVFAFAHVRGGGELGEPWRLGGQKANKVNSILDFIASAEELIRRRVASPATLGAFGQSAGGIVVHGAVVRRPSLFAAVIVNVGASNMVRLEAQAGGPQNADEFGSTKTREGFEALLAMDSYHGIKEGTPYPAMLLATGYNDPRVPAWETAKMAARYQGATSSDRPILVRVGFDEGHAGATQSQEAARFADFYSFLSWHLSKKASP